jgi:hypothetical protein
MQLQFKEVGNAFETFVGDRIIDPVGLRVNIQREGLIYRENGA